MPEAPTLEPDTVLPKRKRRHRAGPAVGREFRRFATHGLEVRSATDGSDSITITGTPIVYNTAYTVMDMFGEFEETMHPGVATNLLALTPDVRFLFNHDGMPLARTLSGTLTLRDGMDGLGMSATLDARQQLANDLAVAIERGDVSQMSCGFVVGLDQWNADWTQRDIYRLEELFDVSAVTYPASPTTSIELSLRAMMAAPVESRARIRVAWKAAHEAREGKAISAANAALLQTALEAFHTADDEDLPGIVASLRNVDAALDQGQAAISAVLGIDNPDDDDSAESTSVEDGTEGGTNDQNAPGVKDGTGSRSAPATAAERRAATPSYNDIQRAVSDAIKAAYPPADGDWCDLWLEDRGDGWVVFHSWEQNPGVGLWRQSYTLDADGVAALADDLVQVVEQTAYVPVGAPQRSRNIRLELEAEQLRLRRRHVAA